MLEGGALHCRDSDLQEMSRDSRSDLCLRKFVWLWGSLGGGRPRGGQGAGGLDGCRLCPQGGQQRPAQLCPSPTGFAGPPDPLHGSSLYQKVRAAAQVSLGPGSTPAAGLAPLCLPGPRGWGAHGLTRGHLSALCPPPQDLGTALFSDTWPPPPAAQPPRVLPPAGVWPHAALSPWGGLGVFFPPWASLPLTQVLPAGMGAQCRPQSTLQGFGYSKEQGRTGEHRVSSGAPSQVLSAPCVDFVQPCGRAGRCGQVFLSKR